MSRKHDRDEEWYRKRKIYEDRPLDALLRCSACKRDDVPASEFSFSSDDSRPSRARRFYCHPTCNECTKKHNAKKHAASRSRTCEHSDGCDRKGAARYGGTLLCRWHMTRWQQENGYECEVPTCEREYNGTLGGRELCSGHRWRMYRWGDTRDDIPLKGDPRDLSTVPVCLYELSDAAGTPIYYGITVHPETRWTNHRRKQPWSASIANARVLVWLQGQDEAFRVERQLIQSKGVKYHLYNKDHNPQTPRTA